MPIFTCYEKRHNIYIYIVQNIYIIIESRQAYNKTTKYRQRINTNRNIYLNKLQMFVRNVNKTFTMSTIEYQYNGRIN